MNIAQMMETLHDNEEFKGMASVSKTGHVNKYYGVDKGIPVPVFEHANTGRGAVYPWKYMDVGDSFFVPNSKTNHKTVYTCMKQANKKYGRTFQSKIVTENHIYGRRVWRTA